MASTYTIDNTSGTLSITIQPGRANGPGQLQESSDLHLYGMGSLQWGEGVDRNVFRIMENFACPEKDYSGGDSQPSGTPDKIWPKGPGDSAIADEFNPNIDYAGISTPTNGQMWFNTTSQKMYAFNSKLDNGNGEWFALGGAAVGVPPTNPDQGDFWFDLGPDRACGQNQMMVYDPDHCEADVGWVSVAQNYLPRCGKTSFCGEINFADMSCPTLPFGDCTHPGKIIGAVLEDCTLVSTDNPDAPDPSGEPAPKRDVHKYAFPEGTKMMFAQPCAPVGWSVDTTADLQGRYLQVITVPTGTLGDGGETGGSHDIWEMTGAQVPQHTHSGSVVSGGSHGHTGAASSAGNHRHTGSTNSNGNHNHPGNTNNNGNHRHTYSQSKSHWGTSGSICCVLSNRMGNYNTSTTGSHNHSFTTYSRGSHNHSFTSGYAGNHNHSVTVYSGGSHSHGLTINNNSGANWKPRYYNVILAVKLDDDDVFTTKTGTSGDTAASYC